MKQNSPEQIFSCFAIEMPSGKYGARREPRKNYSFTILQFKLYLCQNYPKLKP